MRFKYGNYKWRLLLLACSERKFNVPHEVPAWDLYDGVAFRLVKALERKEGQSADLDIRILSAEYGILSPSSVVRTYNRKMTMKRAKQIGPDIRKDLKATNENNKYGEIFIFAGSHYLISLEPIADWCPRHIEIRIAEGRIGEKLKALKNWVCSPSLLGM